MGRASTSKLVAWAFGLAPVALLLSTWGEHLAPLQRLSRTFAFPVFVIEVGIIAISSLQGFKLPKPPVWITGALASLLVLAWATAFTADHAGVSAIRTTLWTVHLFFGVAVGNLVAARVVESSDFPPAIASGFVIFVGLFLTYVIVHFRPGYDWIRDLPAYTNVRWFGYYAAAVVGLCSSGFTKRQTGYWAVAVLALGVALFTGSRGTIFAATAGFCVALLLFPVSRPAWIRFGAALVSGVVLAMILKSALPVGEGYGRLTDSSSSGRVDLWIITLDLIAQRPVFGWGEEHLRFVPVPLSRPVHPHNVVLQILLAWGALGLLLVSILTAWIARKVIISANGSSFPFVLALLNIAAFSLIDGSLFHVQSVATFALCLALAIAPREPVREVLPARS